MVALALPITTVPSPQMVAAPLESSKALAAEQRDATIAKHMPLVRYVAGSMARHAAASSVIDYDDLVGYGYEGLIEAVDTFNPTFNVKFSTWAVMHIRTTIQDAMRTLDPLPRSLRAKGKEIERVSQDLANQHGYWPKETEVAIALGVPLQRLRTTMQDISKVVVSLDSVEDAHGEDSGYSWMSALADEDPLADPAASLDNKEKHKMVVEAVGRLPERERHVVTAYYKGGRCMRDIAEDLGVSESRVSQLHARALKLLRVAIAEIFGEAPRLRTAA